MGHGNVKQKMSKYERRPSGHLLVMFSEYF